MANKTIEQIIFEKRFKGEEFNPNDFNDWAKENEYEAYKLCLEVARQLQPPDERLKATINEMEKEIRRLSHFVIDLKKGSITEDIKSIKNYFGKNDKSPFEHKAYSVLDTLIHVFESAGKKV